METDPLCSRVGLAVAGQWRAGGLRNRPLHFLQWALSHTGLWKGCVQTLRSEGLFFLFPRSRPGGSGIQPNSPSVPIPCLQKGGRAVTAVPGGGGGRFLVTRASPPSECLTLRVCEEASSLLPERSRAGTGSGRPVQTQPQSLLDITRGASACYPLGKPRGNVSPCCSGSIQPRRASV